MGQKVYVLLQLPGSEIFQARCLWKDLKQIILNSCCTLAFHGGFKKNHGFHPPSPQFPFHWSVVYTGIEHLKYPQVILMYSHLA